MALHIGPSLAPECSLDTLGRYVGYIGERQGSGFWLVSSSGMHKTSRFPGIVDETCHCLSANTLKNNLDKNVCVLELNKP